VVYKNSKRQVVYKNSKRYVVYKNNKRQVVYKSSTHLKSDKPCSYSVDVSHQRSPLQTNISVTLK